MIAAARHDVGRHARSFPTLVIIGALGHRVIDHAGCDQGGVVASDQTVVVCGPISGRHPHRDDPREVFGARRDRDSLQVNTAKRPPRSEGKNSCAG